MHHFTAANGALICELAVAATCERYESIERFAAIPIWKQAYEGRLRQSVIVLTRFTHEASAAAADPGMSAALRPVGFLDVLVEACSFAAGPPPESSPCAPFIHAGLHRLATNDHE